MSWVYCLVHWRPLVSFESRVNGTVKFILPVDLHVPYLLVDGICVPVIGNAALLWLLGSRCRALCFCLDLLHLALLRDRSLSELVVCLNT